MKRLARLVPVLLLGLAGTVAAQTPGTPFLEELTWTEVRDWVATGRTAVIVPIGGVEQNGLHIILGKHNYSVKAAAALMAERLNALVAPTVEYVPEGNYNSPNFGRMPGTISNPSPSYDALLDAIARSLAVHGFTDVLFIGDSGSDQNGMTAVADKINTEWAGTGKRVYALRDYYEKAHDEIDAYLIKEKRIPQDKIGSHAGVVGTAQLLFVNPAYVRADRVAPGGGFPDSGASGDPTLATREIGERILAIKIRNGVSQIRSSLAAR